MARNKGSPFDRSVASAADLASDSITTAKILDSNVTLAKVEAALKTGVVSIALSVESADECGTFKVYFNRKVTINKIRTVVTKVLGATADATVTCGNSTGASANGVVTIAATGCAIGDEDSASPTTNNVVPKDSYYYLTTAKGATYGGKLQAFLEYTVTP
ncbi:MAG: hypothetical protein A4E48_00227 [Methanosaeta sp. PtaU1.Bin060]|nr:MAG: hypothetical protein A4E48_00227 [Methanosaeta sp. PtaU1.Bin060]